MNDSIQFHSRVGNDGILNVQVDLGRTEAQKEVVVTIAPISVDSDAGLLPTLSWPEFVKQTYGSCNGLGLERHEQGEFEQREPIA